VSRRPGRGRLPGVSDGRASHLAPPTRRALSVHLSGAPAPLSAAVLPHYRCPVTSFPTARGRSANALVPECSSRRGAVARCFPGARWTSPMVCAIDPAPSSQKGLLQKTPGTRILRPSGQPTCLPGCDGVLARARPLVSVGDTSHATNWACDTDRPSPPTQIGVGARRWTSFSCKVAGFRVVPETSPCQFRVGL
jgi:hypothetical protein